MVFVSMYEIENFAYMFFWEKGLESLRSNPVSHVSVYMYVCMEVGEGVCLWGGGRGVSVGWGKGCVCGVGEGVCLWGEGRGVWGEGRGVWGEGRGVWGEGRGVWGEGRGVWGEGRGVWGEGRGVWGEGRGVWGEGRGVWGEGRGVWGEGRGVWGEGRGVHIHACITHDGIMVYVFIMYVCVYVCV